MTRPGRAPLRVALITGGTTPERDVALAGAGEVLRALRAAGHEVTAVDTVYGALGPDREGSSLALRVGHRPPRAAELARLRQIEDLPGLLRLPAIRNADVCFLVLHGLDGEGGRLQAVLDLGGRTYTGSGMLGSAVAMEKAAAKRVLLGPRLRPPPNPARPDGGGAFLFRPPPGPAPAVPPAGFSPSAPGSPGPPAAPRSRRSACRSS